MWVQVSEPPELELLYSWLWFIIIKKIQTKISDRERHIGQGPGKIRCGAPTCCMLVEVCAQCLFLPLMVCDNKHRVLSTTDSHSILSVQNFYSGVITQTWLTTRLADLQPLQRSSLHCLTYGLHHKSQCQHRLSVGAQGPQVNKDTYQAGHCKG